MTAFRFRFERLARVREIQEEIERGRWLEAEARVTAAETEVGRIEREIAVSVAELRAEQSSSELGPALLVQLHAHLERRHEHLHRVRERVRTLRFQADRLREPWNERRQEVEALSRLEENEAQAWRVEEERLDARRMDEVASTRALRRARSQDGDAGRSDAQGNPERSSIHYTEGHRP